MKTMKLLKPMLLVAGASFLMAGCVVRTRTVYAQPPPPPGPVVAETPGEVEVTSEPPVAPPPGESETDISIGPPPFVGAVWVGGYWGWGAGRWEWRRGYWGRPPRAGAIWIRPGYAYRGGRRVFVRGYWR
jgi:hypothetical protein